MATPFASGYAPVNLLNAAIQAQDARGQQGYLDAQRINEASNSDALNRILQQRALDQQAAAQRAHYGLQQQQLANDLAYRNQALGLTAQQQAEAKRQFDAKLALEAALTKANIEQMNKPGYGMGKDFGLGVFQGAQDVAAHNAAATAIASQATGALAAARQAYKADVAQINDPNWYEAIGRKLPFTSTKQDLLNTAKAKFDATYSNLLNNLGPHRDKVSFIGTPEENGVFQPVLLTPPTMPGVPQSPSAKIDQPTPEPAPVAQDATTAPDVRPTGAGNPFSSYVPPLAQPSGGNFVPQFGGTAPVVNGNPFLSSPFMQQIMTGQAPGGAAPITIAPAPNRALRFNLNTGQFVPLQ